MNEEFKVAVLGRGNQQLGEFCAKLQNYKGLKADFQIRPILIGDKTDDLNMGNAWIISSLKSRATISHPIYTLCEFEGTVDDSEYEFNKKLYSCSVKPLIWVVNHQDKKNVLWPDFHAWADRERHCILCADDYMPDFSSMEELLLLSVLYLNLRTTNNTLERGYRVHKSGKLQQRWSDCSWQLEQSKLLARLRKIKRKDAKLLKHDAVSNRISRMLAENN